MEKKNTKLTTKTPSELHVLEGNNQNMQAILATGVQEMMQRGEKVDLELIRGIMEIQQGINDKQAERVFYADFARMQQEMGVIVTDKKVNFGQTKYDYASISGIIQHIKKPLSNNNFSITHSSNKDGLSTTLLHSGGFSVTCHTELEGNFGKITGMQLSQSLRTNAKRSNLINILNLSVTGEVDNDEQIITENAEDTQARVSAEQAKFEKQSAAKRAKQENKVDSFCAAIGESIKNNKGIDAKFGSQKETLDVVYRKMVGLQQDGSDAWDKCITTYEQAFVNTEDGADIAY